MLFAARWKRVLPFDFAAHQILPVLAFSYQRDLVAVNQCFRRQRTRIVIRRHHKSVSTCAHDREQIAFMQFRDLPFEREKIALFAYRPDDVVRLSPIGV